MIVILAALPEEISLLEAELENESVEEWLHFRILKGRLYGKEVVIAKTGVGKVLSTMLCQHLISTFRPSQLLFTGVAGAIHSELQQGDLIVARDLIQHDFDARGFGCRRGQIPFTEICELKTDDDLYELAMSFSSEDFRVRSGRVLTGDRFITSDNRDAYLSEELKGDVVEMEGASVALVCMMNQVPFLILRTVSDHADGDAKQTFEEFLPIASAHSKQIVQFLLERVNP